MTSDEPRRVEVRDDDETVAAAEVTPPDDSAGAVRASLFPSSGHAPPGSRASLVDADIPASANSVEPGREPASPQPADPGPASREPGHEAPAS
jgi:hypothetical protein